jgi:GDP-mannose 6-dehydrogenase
VAVGKGLTLRLYDASVDPELLKGTNQSYVERHLSHLSRLLVQSPADALEGVECAIVAVGDPDVRQALIDRPPPKVPDLSGLLGSEVEGLPGYSGIAW